MGKSSCSDDNSTGLKKGPWTPEEDQKLINYITKHGHGSWRALPELSGLNRCGKSCRLRWTNYLRPDIKRGKFSPEEERIILDLHCVLGNKWSTIATHLPGRTDNEIKNFWNTHLKKKLIQMGFDPMTHRPRTDIFSSFPHLLALANLEELMGQCSWDHHQQAAVTLQNEAVQIANKIQYLQYLLQPPLPASMTSFPDHNINFISDSPDLSTTLGLLENPNPSTLGIHNSCSEVMPFSHLPALLQAPCSFETSPDNQDNIDCLHGQYSRFSPWLPSSLSPSPSPSAPPVTDEEAIARTGDHACNNNTASFAGSSQSSLWPDYLLLENALSDHEVA